ncbi:hypothetical protein [Aeromicrobium stalagmiti]|uniref:hypothetical protein n=1 Tax=Aeromicrobium stalagmiti TaxID=2738988 RepID=UPI00156998FD|nr:hypothetical protein [Aeromicrobium stalagmiti]NRQ51555.1 hypothetical protein [Aeromicrobium stalagmiti]
MKRDGWIKVEIDPVNHSAFVSGWKAKSYIEQCGGRPLYSRRRKAWSTSENTARDVLALADHDGCGIHYANLAHCDEVAG